MTLTGENQNTHRKTCPIATWSARTCLIATWSAMGWNPDVHGDMVRAWQLMAQPFNF